MKTLFNLFLSISLPVICIYSAYGVSRGSPSEIPVVQSAQTYKVIVKEDIVYARGLSQDSLNSEKSIEIPLKLDVYIPENNSENRPVFLFIHDGGFSNGSKQQSQINN